MEVFTKALLYIALGFIPLMGVILVVTGAINWRTSAGRICVALGLTVFAVCGVVARALAVHSDRAIVFLGVSVLFFVGAWSNYYQLRVHSEGTHLRPRLLGISFKSLAEHVGGWAGVRLEYRARSILGLLILGGAGVGFLALAVMALLNPA